MKVCAESGCPTLTDHTRCAPHERRRDRARGTRQQRGYGIEHARERERWSVKVAAGRTHCARCGHRIEPGQSWDLDHSDDRSHYLGPSHAACNRAAAGQASRR